MNKLKQYFILDPKTHFLNHGSFGACPIPVFEAYQNWQRRLERQPVLFLGREHDALLKESRAALGEYIHADADDLVYVTNATYGVNVVAHSLKLEPVITPGNLFVGKLGQNIFTNLSPCLFHPKQKWLSSSGRLLDPARK